MADKTKISRMSSLRQKKKKKKKSKSSFRLYYRLPFHPNPSCQVCNMSCRWSTQPGSVSFCLSSPSFSPSVITITVSCIKTSSLLWMNCSVRCDGDYSVESNGVMRWWKRYCKSKLDMLLKLCWLWYLFLLQMLPKNGEATWALSLGFLGRGRG